MNYFLYIELTDVNEFSKSYFQLVVSPLVLLILFHHRSLIKEDLNFILITSLLITSFFVFLQLFEQFILGSTNFWFLFDSISISTAQDSGRFEAVNLFNFIRPIGQYHEPSYLGLIGFLFFVVNDVSGLKNKLINFMALFIIFLSLSITVWLFFLVYAFLEKLKTSSLLFLVFFIIIFSLYFDIFTFLRLSEITQAGTSGWYRIMRPFEEFLYVIYNYPTGIPMGNTRFIFDNSFFLMACYLGFFSFPILFVLSILLVSNKIDKRVFLFILTTMFVNGAIITIESFLLIGFLLSTLENNTFKETLKI